MASATVLEAWVFVVQQPLLVALQQSLQVDLVL